MCNVIPIHQACWCSPLFFWVFLPLLFVEITYLTEIRPVMPRNSNNSKRKMDLGDQEFSIFSKRTKSSGGSNTANRSRTKNAEDPSLLFNHKKCVAWFKEYSTPGNLEVIGKKSQWCFFCSSVFKHRSYILGPEGVETLCKDLMVEPENISLLVLAWKMGAKQMGYFSLQEWLHGLTELQYVCILIIVINHYLTQILF